MTIERLLEAGRALESGRLDKAERVYRQVADADPRSSIAVAGLARVASQRGEHDEALRLAEAALAIDPANAAARRLIGEHTPGRATVGAAPGAAPGATEMADGVTTPDDDSREWPWPDLEEQLAEHRASAPGRLARLLRRGRG